MKFLANIVATSIAAIVFGGGASFADAPRLDFARDARPFLDAYCAKCHNAEKSKGGINLEIFKDETSLYRHRARVEEVIEQLGRKSMPPEDARQPDDDTRQKISTWLKWKLESFDPAQFHDPGYLPSHRLTRTQYRNTIRDLIGVGMEVADDLPTDEATFGFDQMGDVQEVSAVHLEKYLEAAGYILDRVFVPPAQSWKFDPRQLEYVRQFGVSGSDEKIDFPTDAPKHEVTDSAHVIYYTGGVTLSHAFPQSGLYRVKVRLWGAKAQGVKNGPSLKLNVDAHRVAETGVPTQGPGHVEEPVLNAMIRSGRHDLKLEMEGMGLAPNATNAAQRFNCAAIQSIEIIGPVVESEEKARAVRERIVVAQPGPGVRPREAARQVLHHFATRAFRRPVSSGEVEELLAFYDRAAKRGDSYENSLKLALKAALVSPDFLFHIEQDRDARAAYRIGDFELAGRLSYFLWSSMPDDELFALAAKNELHEPGVLEAQTQRMLKSPKTRALAENFAPQWLGLRSLFAVHREEPYHENNLGQRKDMHEELVQFFNYVVTEDRSVFDFINADYVFVNQFLADFYGLPGVTGRDFQRVTLNAEQAQRRGGVFGMAAFHFAIAHPKDTNPSGRGKWVLDVLLGTPPPPPPPNVPLLPRMEKGEKMTLRERLSQHRSDPNCAACHAKMDPIGFALENYDQIGKWREKDKDSGQPLDVSGVMRDGKTIRGPAELRNYLATEKAAQFRRSLAGRLLTFALRRGLEYYDEGTLLDLAAALEHNQDHMSALVLGIVKSYPFQFRKNPQLETAEK